MLCPHIFHKFASCFCSIVRTLCNNDDDDADIRMQEKRCKYKLLADSAIAHDFFYHFYNRKLLSFVRIQLQVICETGANAYHLPTKPHSQFFSVFCVGSSTFTPNKLYIHMSMFPLRRRGKHWFTRNPKQVIIRIIIIILLVNNTMMFPLLTSPQSLWTRTILIDSTTRVRWKFHNSFGCCAARDPLMTAEWSLDND